MMRIILVSQRGFGSRIQLRVSDGKKNWEELNFCPKKQNLEIFIGRYQCDILSITEMYNTICILVLVALEMTHFSPIFAKK